MSLEKCPRCGSDFYRGLNIEWVGDLFRNVRLCADCWYRYKSKLRTPGSRS